MVVWDVVKAPYSRYNTLAEDRMASSILAEAIEQWLASDLRSEYFQVQRLRPGFVLTWA